MSLTRRAVVVGILLALFAGRPALAAPLLTDPSGDAGIDAVPCTYVTIVTSGVCPILPAFNEPAIDIVSGDLAVSSGTLTMTIELDDLDHVGTNPLSPTTDDDAYYHMTFRTSQASFVWTAVRSFGHTAKGTSFGVSGTSGTLNPVASVPKSTTYNGTASTVTVTATLSDINTALSSVCSTCSTIGSGTTFTDISVGTQVFKMVGSTGVGTVSPYLDRTDTAASYTIP